MIKLAFFSFQQLESLVTDKIAEVISARSEIGDLRRKCDLFESENEKWKKKQQLLQKMCMDLNTVMKRYIVDQQNAQKDRNTPIKITRSVGLQVSKAFKNAVYAIVYMILLYFVTKLEIMRFLCCVIDHHTCVLPTDTLRAFDFINIHRTCM